MYELKAHNVSCGSKMWYETIAWRWNIKTNHTSFIFEWLVVITMQYIGYLCWIIFKYPRRNQPSPKFDCIAPAIVIHLCRLNDKIIAGWLPMAVRPFKGNRHLTSWLRQLLLPALRAGRTFLAASRWTS